jgi:hypothetical protein
LSYKRHRRELTLPFVAVSKVGTAGETPVNSSNQPGVRQ